MVGCIVPVSRIPYNEKVLLKQIVGHSPGIISITKEGGGSAACVCTYTVKNVHNLFLFFSDLLVGFYCHPRHNFMVNNFRHTS